MLDVHPPHEPIHGWRDFFLHLITITIGLLIALSLEGLVEWQHHRHLVHEAEASLHTEIQNNARNIQDNIADVHQQQANLKQDLVVLRYIIKNHKAPEHSGLIVQFHIRTFDDVSWRTAQSTGVLSYMPYARSQEYADIFATQEQLNAAEHQAARDAIVSLGPLMDVDDSAADPTGGEANTIKQNIEVLQGQLLLVDSLFGSLDRHYKAFLAAHPE